jgi:hypothetical protein
VLQSWPSDGLGEEEIHAGVEAFLFTVGKELLVKNGGIYYLDVALLCVRCESYDWG